MGIALGEPNLLLLSAGLSDLQHDDAGVLGHLVHQRAEDRRALGNEAPQGRQ